MENCSHSWSRRGHLALSGYSARAHRHRFDRRVPRHHSAYFLDGCCSNSGIIFRLLRESLRLNDTVQRFDYRVPLKGTLIHVSPASALVNSEMSIGTTS